MAKASEPATLDVGVGCTVWTGIGSLRTVLLGAMVLEQSLSPAAIACFALIIGGVSERSSRTARTRLGRSRLSPARSPRQCAAVARR